MPAEPQRRKGWAGQLLNLALGADAGQQSLPDFTKLGIELKTLSFIGHGKPLESTFYRNHSLINDSSTTVVFLSML